jgi:hypothetical protein
MRTTRASFAACGFRVLNVADAKGHGGCVHRRVRQRDTGGISADQPHAGPNAPLAALLQPNPQHLGQKIHTDDTSGAGPVTDGGDGDVGGPGAQVEQRLAALQPELADGPGTPSLIQATAQHAIQQVVAARDGVEHPRDAVGLLGAQAGINRLAVGDGAGLGDHCWFRRAVIGNGRADLG